MATNKTKRSIHLAQPQPQRRSPNPQPAAEPMPVQAHVYHSIAELNGGLEKVIRDLKKLKKVPFFHPERLTTISSVGFAPKLTRNSWRP
jgi:hypothetical protein